MSRTGVESKPSWQEVPRPVRIEAERVLGARIVRGARVYGGYAPSATFRLLLADGRRAFFKVCLPWAARLLEFPEPTWLTAVPD